NLSDFATDGCRRLRSLTPNNDTHTPTLSLADAVPLGYLFPAPCSDLPYQPATTAARDPKLTLGLHRPSLGQECECERGNKDGLERVVHVAGTEVRIRFSPARSQEEPSF